MGRTVLSRGFSAELESRGFTATPNDHRPHTSNLAAQLPLRPFPITAIIHLRLHLLLPRDRLCTRIGSSKTVSILTNLVLSAFSRHYDARLVNDPARPGGLPTESTRVIRLLIQ